MNVTQLHHELAVTSHVPVIVSFLPKSSGLLRRWLASQALGQSQPGAPRHSRLRLLDFPVPHNLRGSSVEAGPVSHLGALFFAKVGEPRTHTAPGFPLIF